MKMPHTHSIQLYFFFAHSTFFRFHWARNSANENEANNIESRLELIDEKRERNSIQRSGTKNSSKLDVLLFCGGSRRYLPAY